MAGRSVTLYQGRGIQTDRNQKVVSTSFNNVYIKAKHVSDRIKYSGVSDMFEMRSIVVSIAKTTAEAVLITIVIIVVVIGGTEAHM